MIVAPIILITLAFTIFSAQVDHEHISDNDYIENHTSRWFLRASFIALASLIDFKYSIACALLFWVLFDQLLNLMNGKPILYLGITAKTDKFFSTRIYLYIAIKLLCLVTALMIFLK